MPEMESENAHAPETILPRSALAKQLEAELSEAPDADMPELMPRSAARSLLSGRQMEWTRSSDDASLALALKLEQDEKDPNTPSRASDELRQPPPTAELLDELLATSSGNTYFSWQRANNW